MKLAATLALALLVAGCGGTSKSPSGSLPSPGSQPSTADISNLGTPPTADPGQAVAVVDGQTFTWEARSSIHVRCEVAADRVTVNLQTADGHDFLIQIAEQGGTWGGSVAFTAKESPKKYSGNPATAKVAVSDQIVTYQGELQVREDLASGEATRTVGSLTANCASPGGDPTATMGGTTYTFPISGAQSVVCEFSDTSFRFQINRLAVDNKQLTVEGRLDGGKWIGSLSIIADPDDFSAFIPEDLKGIEVSATGVEYSGTFKHSNDDPSFEEQVQGSVSLVC